MEVDDKNPIVPETIQARFVSETGEEAGPPLDLPTSVNVSQLGRICNAILQNVSVDVFCVLCIIGKKRGKIKLFQFLGGSIKLFILHQ